MISWVNTYPAPSGETIKYMCYVWLSDKVKVKNKYWWDNILPKFRGLSSEDFFVLVREWGKFLTINVFLIIYVLPFLLHSRNIKIWHHFFYSCNIFSSTEAFRKAVFLEDRVESFHYVAHFFAMLAWNIAIASDSVISIRISFGISVVLKKRLAP